MYDCSISIQQVYEIIPSWGERMLHFMRCDVLYLLLIIAIPIYVAVFLVIIFKILNTMGVLKPFLDIIAKKIKE